MNLHVEPLARANLERLLPLIADYQRFYRCDPHDGRNREYFGSLLDHPERGIQFVAWEDEQTPVGFATLYFHGSSLSAQSMCVLNDLYTLPDRRGQGIARALIDYSRTFARRRGYHAMEWQTQKENHTAQRLYDRLGAQRTEWITYLWELGE